MRVRRIYLAFGVVLALAFATACHLTTANISSLKLGKDKDVTNEATTFGPNDKVYARAEVSNVPSKVTVKVRLILEKVEGQPENAPEPGSEKSFDFPQDGWMTYTLTPPPSGWPPGTYRVEARMFIENGEQKDQKSANFTVSRD
ncbi:MAG: hypothetical protein DMF68_15215 [Acidobacteria bacterium]|nr:MAG: hypothetical protein DMF68_15215 [Acidobacteriota bacterium]